MLTGWRKRGGKTLGSDGWLLNASSSSSSDDSRRNDQVVTLCSSSILGVDDCQFSGGTAFKFVFVVSGVGVDFPNVGLDNVSAAFVYSEIVLQDGARRFFDGQLRVGGFEQVGQPFGAVPSSLFNYA